MYGSGVASAEMIDCSALLRHLNVDELKGLLNDEDKLNALIAEQVRGVVSEKEMLLTNNKSLAEFNLSREPRLSTLRTQLAHTYEQAVAVFSEAEAKKKQLEDAVRHNSLDTTLAILQTAAAQSEEESESIAEKFLDGGLDVEAFLDDFQTKRKVAHLRRIKVDKMTELLESAAGRRSTVGAASAANNMNWNPSAGLYANHQPPAMPPQISHYGH